jgi:hypothetical protein
MNSEELQEATGRLLNAAGMQGDFSLDRLAGGANNRVFRVDTNGSTVLLKQYFQHPGDPRDRVGAEFAFCSYAWDNGLRSLPQPLACDAENRLALYEFVRGRPVQPGEVDEQAVDSATSFYLQINRYKSGAGALPTASEACFTIAEHLTRVERRVQALRDMDGSSDIDGEAISFTRNSLSEAWETARKSAMRQANTIGVALDSELSRRDRCISPSDFGFHNALVDSESRLRFIDFEYAGWDDPAKMVCDFFCQPAVPVPMSLYDRFVDSVVSGLDGPDEHSQRISLLMPVYRIKWCCIMLNDFLPWGGERRRFTRNGDDSQRKAEQLEKARRALAGVTDQQGR